MFVVASPASPAVLSNVVVSIEQHVDWLAEALAFMRERGFARIEPTPEAEDAWTAHVAEVGDTTLFPQADSWYLGANIPGKPRVFMAYLGGVAVYRRICDDVAAGGYATFTFA
jgi:cyclohexanone monooxygenase